MSDERAEAILDLAGELLAIPSESGHERAICDFLERRIEAQRPHALVRAGNSLCIATSPPTPGKRTVMLLGHTDTVPALEDNPVRRDGDRLFGLGASDMKAACAIIVDALERSRGEPARHDLVGVLYAREETAYELSEMPLIHAAARAWFDRVDLAVCMEPTDNAIELGCLGTSHARLTFHGKRAHSARPWQGENAIHKAAGLLSRLAARAPVAHEFAGLRFVESMSATTVDFRGARNVIPDRFVVNVNYRFAPGKDERAVRAEVDALVAGEADVEIVDFCPAGRVCADNPLVDELRAAAGGVEVRAKQAWTDVGRLSQLGIDAINWGPGALAQAHQAGEWVSVAEVRRAAAAVERWLFAGSH